MSNDAVRDALRGVAVGVLTPFDSEGSIRFDALESNVEALSEAGAGVFLANANISEYHSLSHEERIDVTEAAIDATAPEDCVLAGVGGSTASAVSLTRAHESLGADAIMVMPPDHTYVHEQGLLEYYDCIDAASTIPTVPYIRGFDPSIDFLGELSRLDGVLGVKYALENAPKLGAAIEAGDPDTVWVNGLAESFAPAFFAEGAEGFTAGVSNFVPALGLELFDALEEGDAERARALRDVAAPFQRFRSGTGANNELGGAVSVPAVKAGLDAVGLEGGAVREPIVGLTDADRDRAETLVAEIQASL